SSPSSPGHPRQGRDRPARDEAAQLAPQMGGRPAPVTRSRGKRVAVAVGLLALAATLLGAWRFGPFANPDEGAHYLRAYEVSRGHLLNLDERHNGIGIACADYLIA